MSFHVPEQARVTEGPFASDYMDGNNGHFQFDSPVMSAWQLVVIASDGAGWEHISVHARHDHRHKRDARTPYWREMVFLKRQFWDAEDVVMQLHPAESEYVNCHPHVLHLWRPVGATIPTPPSILVGLQVTGSQP